MDWKNMDVKDFFKLTFKSSKKPVRATEKRGINLARHEDEDQQRKQMRLIIGAAVVVLLLIIKFGVVDLYVDHALLSKQYKELSDQKQELTTELKDYDKILLEYRTYSMDWMDDDDEDRYVSVARRTVLDLVEDKMLPCGNLVSLAISGDTMTIEMSGMSLQQVSAMCADVEKSPFVASTVLQTASTESGANTANFCIEVRLQRDSEKED